MSEPDALAVEPNFDDLGVNSESGCYVSLERIIEQNKVPYSHPEATPRLPRGYGWATNKASNRRFAQVIRPTDACLGVRGSPIRLPPRGSKTDPGL